MNRDRENRGREPDDVREVFDDVIGDEIDEARQREWNVAFSVASFVNRLGGGVIDIWLPGVGTEAARLVDLGLTEGQQEQIRQEQSRQIDNAGLIVAVPSEKDKEYAAVSTVLLPKNL